MIVSTIYLTLFSTFTILLISRLGFTDYVTLKGNKFISSLFSCSFCLSFWVNFLIAFLFFIFSFPHYLPVDLLLIVILATPLTRFLL